VVCRIWPCSVTERSSEIWLIGNTALVLGQSTYLGVAVILTFVVRQLPPYRPVTWIAGEAAEAT
jgi:hypothetical protein